MTGYADLRPALNAERAEAADGGAVYRLTPVGADVRDLFEAWEEPGGFADACEAELIDAWDGIEEAARLIVTHPGYRTPDALGDWVRFARTLIVTTSQLYRVLYPGGAPLIGNRTHIETLPWP